LKENPDQSRRDHFGQVLWDFFHLHIEQNVHTFHADIHPGNFLFLPDGRVGVIDFGCVKTFPEDFLDGCIRLVQNYLLGNHSGFTDELVKMEFLKNSDAEEATEKMIKALLTEFAELLSNVYRKPVFDFSDTSFRKKLNAMLKKGMEIREIRGSRHFVFFNRIVFGLLSMLMKLGSRIETGNGQQAVMGWKMKAAA
ncbi:MAG: AarF/UbiB family protein, partial [SAR324 cluster bacterium]|nr:AarF/UbiB family protein [SAR324 cluster bacterium]